MYRRFRIFVLIFLISMLVSGFGFSQSTWSKDWNGGIYAGIGLPKMPLSLFRNPVSISGGGFVNYRIRPSILLQLDGAGLYTFNMGTVDNSDGTLRYNLVWTSFAVMKRIHGPGRNETFISVGVGGYKLHQQFNEKKDNISSGGVNIGLVNWSFLRRIGLVTEFRWHLLFETDPNPQVLVIHFGLLL